MQMEHKRKTYVYFQKVLFVFELLLISVFGYKNSAMKINLRLWACSPGTQSP